MDKRRTYDVWEKYEQRVFILNRQDYMPSPYLFTEYLEINNSCTTQNISLALDTKYIYILGLYNKENTEAELEISFMYPSCVKIDPQLLKSVIFFVCVIGFVILVSAITVFIKCVFCKKKAQTIKQERLKQFEKNVPNRKHKQVTRFLDFINAPEKKMSDCVICLQQFINEDGIKVLFCLHYFHEKCIMGWLYENPFCPLCKLCIDKYDNLEITIKTSKLKYQDTIGSNKFIESISKTVVRQDISETLNDLVANTTQASQNLAIFSIDDSSKNVLEATDIEAIDGFQYKRKKRTVNIRKPIQIKS